MQLAVVFHAPVATANTDFDSMAQKALYGTTSILIDAQVPRNFLTALA
jgi:hypothetical protein